MTLTLTFGQAFQHTVDTNGRVPAEVPRIDGPIVVLRELEYWNGPAIFRTVVASVPAIAWWFSLDSPSRSYLVVAHAEIDAIPDDLAGWTWEHNPFSAFPVTGWIVEDQLTYPESTESTP